MSSQLAQSGDIGLVNYLAGNSPPLVTTSTPSAPNSFGQLWVNAAASSVVSQWNGSAWVSLGAANTFTDLPLYIALLTQDPINAGATTVANLTECQTTGYARQSVNFTAATTAYPSVASNSNLLTFGPMTTTMVIAVQWAALVTTASGVGGYFLASWAMNQSVSVDASQSIYCGIGQLTLQGQ